MERSSSRLGVLFKIKNRYLQPIYFYASVKVVTAQNIVCALTSFYTRSDITDNVCHGNQTQPAFLSSIVAEKDEGIRIEPYLPPINDGRIVKRLFKFKICQKNADACNKSKMAYNIDDSLLRLRMEILFCYCDEHLIYNRWGHVALTFLTWFERTKDCCKITFLRTKIKKSYVKKNLSIDSWKNRPVTLNWIL